MDYARVSMAVKAIAKERALLTMNPSERRALKKMRGVQPIGIWEQMVLATFLRRLDQQISRLWNFSTLTSPDLMTFLSAAQARAVTQASRRWEPRETLAVLRHAVPTIIEDRDLQILEGAYRSDQPFTTWTEWQRTYETLCDARVP